MTIDESFGLPPLRESLRIPLVAFPEALRKSLVKVLSSLSGSWTKLEMDAFHHNDMKFFRVTLDLGSRPLHFYLFEDGELFQFDAPVFYAFPHRASHFVLRDLCCAGTLVSFRLDALTHVSTQLDQGTEPQSEVSELVSHTTEILYGWGRFSYHDFLKDARVLVPYLIERLEEAESRLKAFLNDEVYTQPNTAN
jgi:hypothetical protein